MPRKSKTSEESEERVKQDAWEKRANENPSWGIKPYHAQLERGYHTFSKALLPKYPLVELSKQNIAEGSEGLNVWEQSEEISEKWYLDGGGKETLVNKMLYALEFTMAHPGVLDLNMVALQIRCKSLQQRIYKKILDNFLKNNNHADMSFAIQQWTTDIERNILDPASHDLIWYNENLRKILGLIDVSSQAEKGSALALVLNQVLRSSYIPYLDHLKVVRDILLRSDALDGDAAAACARRLLDDVDPKSIPDFSITKVKKAIGDIRLAFENRDFLTVQKLITFFDTMPGTNNEQILGQVQFVLLDLATAVEKNGTLEQDDLARSLFTAGRTFYDTISERSTRPSAYSSDSISRSQPIRIAFQDISLKNVPSYTKHGDFRTWKTSSLEANPDEPMHSLLLRFVAQANIEHRHPYFPVLEFDFQIVRSSSADEHTETLHFGGTWFTQGSVRDVLLGSELLLYNRHDAPDDFKEAKPPLRMLFPSKRQYPASNPQPPAHWIATPKVEGPWKEIMSLQLIGDGAELTAHSTYPSLIAKTVFIPADFSVVSTKGIMLKRLRVRPEHLGTKFTFPITFDQARSLLGRTVYYQCVDDENQPVKRSKAAAKRAKLKAEDPIYIAYVWGLDPDAKLLKTMEHANEDSGELCRTFQFDNSGAPLPVEFESASLSDGYPPLRKVARFDWIGLAELPLPTGPTKEEIAAEEALDRERKRFAAILAAAPRLFEVGINGDCAFVVGELNLHPPGAAGTVTVENCKVGIWESGYAERDNADDGEFLIWVKWIQAGTIDLNAPASEFAPSESRDHHPLEDDRVWEDNGSISVDGGIAGVLARGILSHNSMVSLTGESNARIQEAYLEMLMLSGSEDGRYHIPGGISSYTGGDGSFSVQISKDDQGDMVALRLTGNGGMDDDA